MRKIRIDRGVFERLCEIQCTSGEICDFFHITEEQLEEWCGENYKHSFSDVYAQQRAKGIIKLRYMQFKQAEKNPTMAAWLGQQYLNQSYIHDGIADISERG